MVVMVPELNVREEDKNEEGNDKVATVLEQLCVNFPLLLHFPPPSLLGLRIQTHTHNMQPTVGLAGIP